MESSASAFRNWLNSHNIRPLSSSSEPRPRALSRSRTSTPGLRATSCRNTARTTSPAARTISFWRAPAQRHAAWPSCNFPAWTRCANGTTHRKTNPLQSFGRAAPNFASWQSRVCLSKAWRADFHRRAKGRGSPMRWDRLGFAQRDASGGRSVVSGEFVYWRSDGNDGMRRERHADLFGPGLGEFAIGNGLLLQAAFQSRIFSCLAMHSKCRACSRYSATSLMLMQEGPHSAAPGCDCRSIERSISRAGRLDQVQRRFKLGKLPSAVHVLTLQRTTTSAFEDNCRRGSIEDQLNEKFQARSRSRISVLAKLRSLVNMTMSTICNDRLES